jgi:mRNA-degrading endonuclease RelE of RelBE toxin-antitoxin system
MVDKIDKALAKLSEKERLSMQTILRDIQSGHTSHLDIKKLQGRDDVYRIRKGKMRIIFQKKDSGIHILAVEKRSDTTY